MNKKLFILIGITVLLVAVIVVLKATGRFGSTSSVDALPVQDGLPSVVEETRQEIARAAALADYDAIALLVSDEGFSYTFGDQTEQSFAQFLQEEDVRRYEAGDERIVDEMLTLLSLPYGVQLDYYVWPASFIKSADEWTDEDLDIMRQIVTEEEIEGYRDFGAYIGWRIGIRSNGEWVYFIAGD